MSRHLATNDEPVDSVEEPVWSCAKRVLCTCHHMLGSWEREAVGKMSYFPFSSLILASLSDLFIYFVLSTLSRCFEQGTTTFVPYSSVTF